MSVAQIARTGKRYAFARIASDGDQNFLGARWVERLVSGSPDHVREQVALHLLALSPHYFYDRDICAEDQRNRKSRKALAEAIIFPHVSRSARVIDYGCGPGYLAQAVAARVDHVDAIDISRGVLACAQALNNRPNISYLTPGEFRGAVGNADLAYSFAVAQHLRTELLVDALRLLAAKIRHGGTLLLHFATPGHGGWRTEADWHADRSVARRVKLRYGLNCFGRSPEEMETLVSTNGFKDITMCSLAEGVTLPESDDIVGQQMLIARRR